MPKSGEALKPAERDLIRRWIAEGAPNDTPANAVQRYSPEHPPVYSLPPVISSLTWSLDGNTLAIAGFHEVILYKSDGSAPAGRLIGLSERITSVRYSPDGSMLAATGGLPARMGEVQVWDVATGKLRHSVPVTFRHRLWRFMVAGRQDRRVRMCSRQEHAGHRSGEGHAGVVHGRPR